MTLYIHLRDQFDDDVEEIRHRFIPADSIEIDDDGNISYLGINGVWDRVELAGNKYDGCQFLYTDSDNKTETFDICFIRDRLMEGCRVGLQVFSAEDAL